MALSMRAKVTAFFSIIILSIFIGVVYVFLGDLIAMVVLETIDQVFNTIDAVFSSVESVWNRIQGFIQKFRDALSGGVV